MDVRTKRPWLHLLTAVFLGAVLSGCAKNIPDVFPDGANSASNDPGCAGQRHENQFLVVWDDGHISNEHFENKNVFVDKFLNPNLARIRHAEFNKIVHIHQDSAAGGLSEFSSLDSGFTTTAVQTWGPDKIEAPLVWSQGITGAGVKVAVVDSAVDYNHPQLSPRLDVNVAENNGSAGQDDDHNGYVDDYYGWDFYGNKNKPSIIYNTDPAKQNKHGTHVAGIIAADHSMGPVRGVAPGATIIPANFMDDSGSGSLDVALHAIDYVVSRGAKVINASWGGTCGSEALRQKIISLEQKGVLIVVAAGNSSADLESYPEYPAAYNEPAQITVGATYSDDYYAGFSNSSINLVHLAAPGGNIYSTFPTVYSSRGYLDGTSMAAPMVSGAAALLWSARPRATLAQIKSALINSVDVKNYRVMSRGRLNARKAVEEIIRLVP